MFFFPSNITTEQLPPDVKNLAYTYNLRSDFWPDFLLEMVKLEKVKVCVGGFLSEEQTAWAQAVRASAYHLV